MISTRNLRENEAMPEGFATGFEKMPVMRDWVWIAESEGAAIGVMLAAPCHGLVYMVRLCVKDGANQAVATILIRACMAECSKRGFKGYFFHVDPMREIERNLIPICRKAKAIQVTIPQIAIIGSVEDAVKL